MIDKLVICFFIFLGNFSFCMTTQCCRLNLLTIKDMGFIRVLSDIIEEEMKYGEINHELILIRVDKDINGFEVRVGLLSKKSMSDYLTEKTDTAFGYFEHKGITGIVYGVEGGVLFNKKNNKKFFSYLNPKPEIKNKVGKVPPPPVVYEPIVWIFNYGNNEFKLINKGRFTLLK